MNDKLYFSKEAFEKIKKDTRRNGYKDGIQVGCDNAAKAIEEVIRGNYHNLSFGYGTEELKESLARLHQIIDAHRSELQ
jgi:hypothetical protein